MIYILTAWFRPLLTVLVVAVLLLAGSESAFSQGIRYVDSSKVASGNGTTWGQAYKTLQEALVAANGSSAITQIWVRKGTYYPTGYPVGSTGGSTARQYAFAMRGNLALYGGFAGAESAIGQRVAGNITTLSGDIGVLNDSTDNCYHVMVIAGIAASADSIILDGLTITGANAQTPATAPLLLNGRSDYGNEGGGIYLDSVLNGNKTCARNCTIAKNIAIIGGGGYVRYSSPFFTACTFRNNTANLGGGMYCSTNSHPNIDGCSFLYNSAIAGGGIRNEFSGIDEDEKISNCIFVGNTAGTYGSAIQSIVSRTSAVNCTFVANNNTSVTGGHEVVIFSSTQSVLSNSIFWGNNNLAGAAVNFNGSPGNAARFSTIQGGLYGSDPTISTTDPLFVNLADPDGADNVFGTADDGIRLQSGSPAVNTGTNSTIAAGVATDFAGAPRIQLHTVDMGAYESPACPSGTVLYVDSSASVAGNNGATWATAYKELRTAMAVARQCSGIATIYVARGTYRPTADSSRDSSFVVTRGGLKIYGGYPSGGGTRDIAANPTVLSGQHDYGVYATGNCYHVVVVAGLGASADSVVMDGLTISHGSAFGYATFAIINGQNISRNSGSGLYMQSNANGGKVTIRNCAITNNLGAYSGGGIYCYQQTAPNLANCTITSNSAGYGGGLYCNDHCSPSVRNCRFANNTALYGGGVCDLFYCAPTISNCSFDNNTASTAGGEIFNDQNSSPDISTTTFATTYSGSATIQNSGSSSPRIVNCVISGSMAGLHPVIANDQSSPFISGCTVFGTSPSNSGIIYNYGYSAPNITNSVVWGNINAAPGVFAAFGPGSTVSYSLVQGGYAGAGNLSAPPLFASTADPDGVDNILGTPDDGLRLSVMSPAINAGINDSATAAGITGDMTGAARIQSTTVDMGAYEGGVCPAYTTIYVDSSAATTGDGNSWGSAVRDLRTALSAARQCSAITVIRVAKGTYKPTAGTSRDSTFAITRSNLKIYGGYPSGGGTRDIVANPTVLSGDIGVAGNNTDNSHHVAVITNADTSTLLDGFVIRGGNANGSGAFSISGLSLDRLYGGGVLIHTASPSLANCAISANRAEYGGGLYVTGASPVISACAISGNTGGWGGGGLYSNNASAPVLRGCAFSGNVGAYWGGGAVYTTGASPAFTNCLFTGNTGYFGGAGYSEGSSASTFRNCTFHANGPGPTGGGGALNDNGTTLTVSNAIFWGNSGAADLDGTSGSSISITYSTVQSGYAGTGNMSNNPLFFNAADPDGADNRFGTADDGLMPGCASPALNSGAATGAPATDIVGTARPVGLGVDRGAYEQPGIPLADSVTIAATATDICAGTPVTFTATPVNGGTTPAYQWLKNGAVVGGATTATFVPATLSNGDVIKAVMTSSLACVAPLSDTSNAIPIAVTPAVVPTVSISASATTACAGTGITFYATPANGGAAPAYQWKKNSISIAGATANTYSTIALANSDTISVALTSNAACAIPATVASNKIVVAINPLLTPDVTIAATATAICTGQSVTFTATPVNGGLTPTYQWRKNGALIAGAAGAVYTGSGFANGDVIKAVLTSSATCPTPLTDTSNAVTLTVNTAVTPAVSISASSPVACPGTSVTFTAMPANGGPTPAYQWLNNDLPIGGATGHTYSSAVLSATDSISVKLTSSAACATPATATSARIGLPVYASVLYVDSSVAASGNGASWATAMRELRTAVLAARQCSGISEIRVARGTYKPALASRDSAFTIVRGGLKIYGGYPGGGGARNITANPTVLSGDLGNPGDSTDNSYHVAVVAGLSASDDSLVMDGLTITRGRADGSISQTINGAAVLSNEGAGLYLHSNSGAGGKIAVRNCLFTNNSTGTYGGGLYNRLSSPEVSNCVFRNNAAMYGGGIFNHISSPAISGCRFTGNTGYWGGGGVYNNSNAAPTISNGIFSGNVAGYWGGGAIYNTQQSTLNLRNSVLLANSGYHGGAVYDDAGTTGGAISGSTFRANTGGVAGGVYVTNATAMAVTGCILWNNTGGPSGIVTYGGTATASHSLVQGGYPGNGNVNADPLFVNADDPDGADNILGTADDGLQLAYCSPAINTGGSTVAGADITGSPRTLFATVDMGAYEKQTAAPADIADQAALSAESVNAIPFVKGCDDGIWTYYAIPGNLDSIGFAVAWNGNTAAANAALVTIVNDAANTAQVAASAGIFAMRRYWNVNLNGQALTTPVQVRFYYDAADTVALSQTAAASGLAPASAVKWFKTIGVPYAPLLLTPDTINAPFTLLMPSASGLENNVAWVQFDSITSFSGGTAMINSGSSATLPVTLVSFDAAKRPDGRAALLRWEVGVEDDLLAYEVQRSEDGSRFVALGSVPATGSRHYDYTDEHPANGANYYRLSMRDYDGSYRYSAVRLLTFPSRGTITIAPNPMSNQVVITLADAALAGTDAVILDARGQLVARFAVADRQTIEVGSWASGIYMLRLADGSVFRIEKR